LDQYISYKNNNSTILNTKTNKELKGNDKKSKNLNALFRHTI